MKSNRNTTRIFFKSSHRAFSLIELLVSIAIFTVITSIVFLSQSNFGGSILITNLGYDVALSIRQAQVYGISVKQTSQPCTGATGTDTFQCSYGIHFENQYYYILFADINGDNSYNAGGDNGSRCNPGTECVSFFKIEKGNGISMFCANTDCAGAGANGNIDALDILFRRPNPEPLIRGYKGGTVRGNPTSATITVSSPQGITKRIVVSAVGQISTQ